MAPRLFETTEAELHHMVREGAVGACEGLYTLVAKVARGTTRRAASWGSDPEDLLHDVYVAVYRAIRSGAVRSPERLGAYVVSTAQKRVNDSLRRHIRRRMEPMEEEGARYAGRGLDPERQVVMADLRDRLEVLLGNLPKVDQTIVRNFYYDEMPWQTIAEKLRLSPTQFRLRKCRALARMRSMACVDRPGALAGMPVPQ